jgi:hypothetical protein
MKRGTMNEPKINTRNALKDLWWGRCPLGEAFWGFYVIGTIVCWIIIFVIYIPFYILHLSTIGLILAFIIYCSYFFVSSVGVWHSADAYPFQGAARFWAIAAKIVVCLYVGRFLWGAANGGALQLMAVLTGGVGIDFHIGDFYRKGF